MPVGYSLPSATTTMSNTSSVPTPLCNPRVFIDYFWAPPQYEYEDDYMIEGDFRLKTIFGLLCCYYCALTWTLSDHVHTFDDEVEYVWKRPMRAGSVLFYLVRYLGIVLLLAGIAIYLWPELEYARDGMDVLRGGCGSPRFSAYYLAGGAEHVMFWAVPAVQFSIFWSVEAILQTRIFALYGSRGLAKFNGFVFFLVMSAMIGLWYDGYAPMTLIGDAPIGPSLEWTYSAVYWLPGIGFDLWLAILAFKKLRPQVLKHDLLSVIVKDSIRYFFLIAFVMVVHVIGTFKAFGIYVVPFVIAGQTIGGSRLVLHLRRAYFRSHDPDGSGPGISFAARTTGVPVPRSRFADETFYVQDNLSDEEFEQVMP